MSFFSGIGDFFRGAFGEDDEEKRRRKERERQESQKRAQSKQKSTSNYSPKRSNSYFNNNVKSSPNPFGVPMNAPKPEVNKVDFPAPSLDAKKSLAPKQSFLNKLIDRVDANTESDKFRREQEGKARDYRQSQRDAGEKDYTNPFQRVGFEFVERPIKALNTVGSAAVGIKDQTENLNDLIKIKLAYSRGKISKDDYEKMSEAVSNRNSEARFGGKGGILGVGSFYDDVDELEDKKKLASTILQTGGELSQFLPQGKAFEAGLKASGESLAAKKLLQKEVYENVAGGFASNAGEQVEQGKLDLKGLLVGATIDGLSPIALKKFGGGLSHLKKSGAGDETLERVVKKVRDARTPEEAERLINSLDEIRAKENIDSPNAKVEPREELAIGSKASSKLAEETPSPTKTGPDLSPARERIAKQIEDVNNITRDYVKTIRENPSLNVSDKARLTDEVATKYRAVRADLDASLSKTMDQVDEAGDAIKASQAARQDVVGELQDAKTATPEVGVKATPTPEPATVAEVNVNNAYQPGDNAFKGVDATQTTSDLLDDLLTRGGDDIDRQDRSSVLGKLFGAIPKTTQKVTNPMSDLTNKVLTAASNSGNGITSRAAQAPRGVWSRFGMGDASRAALDSVSGLKNTSRSVGLRIARRRNETVKKLIEQGAEPSDITRLLHQVFETPEFLARKYGDDVAKLSPDKLPPALRQIVDEQIELNKVRNQINFDTGIIDEKAYFQGQDGMHTPRVYGFDFAAKNANGGALDSTYNNFDTTAGVRRNELSDVPDEIFDTVVDPLTAQDIRFQQALVNKSRMDAIQNIQSEFRVFDKAPNNGFSRLEGKQFGPLDGKFVDSQVATTLNGSPIFKTDLGSRANDLLDVYRDSPLGKADRLIKQTKTVGAVGTHVGNIGGNVTLFSTGAGVDPATALARGIGGARSLISDARGGLDPEVYYLRKLGIIGDDTGRAINGIAQKDVIKVESLLTEAENLARKNPNKAARLFSGAWGKLQDIYGGTDDAFKLGIFRELKSRGYKDDLAARLIREQFQNYGNVGRGVGMLADSPVLGKPFARFIPELGRITKNTVKNNPVGAAASIGGLSYASNKLSEMSGETEEERDRRENAVGQTKVPLTSGINKLFGGKGDVSLNFALPGDTSVNVARSVGLNFPIEPNSDASSAVVNQLNPFSLPTRTDKGGHTVFAPEEGVSSMALNPIARLIANRDFMGRRITDPDNPVRWEGNGQTRYKYENPDGSPMDDTKNSNYNRGKSLLMSYLPFSSEIDAGLSSVGDKEDYYGKNRTPPQAIARMFGFKTEDNSQGSRDKKAEQSKYFEDKLPATQKFLDENPDLSDAYWGLKNTARDRNTEISQNDQVSPERYKVIASDKSGRLFNFLKAQAIATAKEKGTQVDPLYTLLPEEANQVIALKAMYTGDDTKFQQLLYKQPWYTAYKDADRAYQSQKPESGSFPGSALPNARPTEWYGLSEQLNDPDKGIVANYPLVQKYKAEINKFVDYDSDERKAFTKNWYANYGDAYTAQSDAFKSAQLDLVNKMRAIEGAPPLTPEIWAGRFETDDAKSYGSGSGGGYSRGYGGGGGGGSSSRQNDTNKLNNIANTTVSSPLDYIQPKDMPAIQALLRKLEAGGGGRKATPKLGAASRGTG